MHKHVKRGKNRVNFLGTKILPLSESESSFCANEEQSPEVKTHKKIRVYSYIYIYISIKHQSNHKIASLWHHWCHQIPLNHHDINHHWITLKSWNDHEIITLSCIWKSLKSHSNPSGVGVSALHFGLKRGFLRRPMTPKGFLMAPQIFGESQGWVFPS